MKWKRMTGVFVIGLLAGIVFFQVKEAKAEEKEYAEGIAYKEIEDYEEKSYEDIPYEEIQRVLEEVLEESSFDFEATVEQVVAGEDVLSGEMVLKIMKDTVCQKFIAEKSSITRILTIAIIGALFVNFSNVFKGSQVADTGFFVTYLLLFSVLSLSFYGISQTASEALEGLLEFMRALLPAYFIAVSFSTGSAASIAFYETAMFLIVVVETVLVKTVIPIIHIYFVIRLTNYISREDYLSKAAEFLEMLITWVVRTLLGVTVGYNFIQGMVLPAADQLKRTVWLRTAKLIPGVGSAIGSVAESVLGAGVLVKNAVGVVGILVIVTIVCVPMVKIAFYCVVYKIAAVIIQPISDKRILECLEGAGKGAGLLLYLVFAGSALFLLSIAIALQL